MTMINITLPQNIQLRATHESWTFNIIDIGDITFEACPTSAVWTAYEPIIVNITFEACPTSAVRTAHVPIIVVPKKTCPDR